MIQLKRLGLAVVAAGALMACGGGGAASGAEFHTNTIGAALHGTQSSSHELILQGSKTTCGIAEISGETVAATAKSQTVSAKYANCTAFGLPVEISMNGCDYVFKTEGGVMDLNCPPGAMVTLRSTSFFGTCHVDIFPKTGINGISYTNSADKKSFTIHTASTNLDYNVTTSTGVCPLTVGSGTNAGYTGTTTVTAGGATVWHE